MLPKIQNSNAGKPELKVDPGQSMQKLGSMATVVPKVKPISKKAIEKIVKKTKQSLSSISDFPAFFDFMRKENSEYHQQMEDMQRQSNSRKDSRHKEVMDIIISATQNKRKADKKIKSQIKKDKVEQKKEEAKPPTTPAPKTEAPAPAPKVEAAKTTAPAPQPAPATTPPPTAKPVTITPPTVQPAPAPVPRPLPSVSTVGKAAVATATGVSLSKAIGAAESGGNYNITYGDRMDKKSGKIVSSLKSKTDPKQTLKTPQDLFGKPLTDLTLEEIQQFQKYKDSEIPGTGAVGKYQFMPTTLFGRKDKKGNFIPGLVQEMNLPMNTKFDESTQDRLFELLHSKDVATLKRLGVPITPGFEYMAHYLGAGGTNAVYKAIQAKQDVTVAQALTAAGLKVGQNEELYKIKVSEFEKILEGRLVQKGGFTPHSAGEATPNKIMDMSVENAEMKKFMRQGGTGQQVIIQQNFHSTTNRQHFVPPTQKQELNPTMQ